MIKIINLKRLAFIDEPNRCSGRTTKLVDYYIQELFNNLGEHISIKDHFDNGNNKQANRDLYNKILDRLEREHAISRSNIYELWTGCSNTDFTIILKRKNYLFI